MQLEMQMVPRARSTDPITSHEAAESQRETLAEKQAKVLSIFKRWWHGSFTDERLSELCEQQFGWPRHKSTARTRRAELERLGEVMWTGEYVTLSSGRRAKTWRAA